MSIIVTDIGMGDEMVTPASVMHYIDKIKRMS